MIFHVSLPDLIRETSGWGRKFLEKIEDNLQSDLLNDLQIFRILAAIPNGVDDDMV
jgi:hypothetical protein